MPKPQEKPNPRRLALTVLLEVAQNDAYANLALARALRVYEQPAVGVDHAAADRALLTELVYGTLRRQGTIDYILAALLNRPLASLPLKILLILRLGAYQLLYMQRIPASAAVNESVKLAKRFGHQGTAALTNGVLRNLERQRQQLTWPDPAEQPAAYLAAVASHPQWLVQQWLERFGFAETQAICEFDNQPAPYTLRVNTLKTSRAAVLARLGGAGQPLAALPEGIMMTEGKGGPVQQLIAEGLLYPQQVSSMLAAHLLAPQPGSRVLDVCAAPGGKTTHMAALMQNQGEIWALDLHEHKLRLLQENAARLGISCIHTQGADSRDLKVVPDNWADYLLVDAPCSGLGVLRSRPDARWRRQPGIGAEMAPLAYAIWQEAAQKLRPGGVMLFATCTISQPENEDNLARFLAEHKDFVPEPLAGEAAALPDFLRGTASRQILPQQHGMEGFFYAKLRRLG